MILDLVIVNSYLEYYNTILISPLESQSFFPKIHLYYTTVSLICL